MKKNTNPVCHTQILFSQHTTDSTCHTEPLGEVSNSTCHTERREVSHNTESKRDFSPTAQNDKIVTCHTERSEVSTTTYKPSGIEWLGEIPQGWEIKKLKYIGEIFGGVTGKTIKDFSKEYKLNFKPYITFTNVCNNAVINPDLMEYVFIDSKEKQNKVLKNDILFLQSSETFEDVGKSAIYLNDDEVYLNTFCKGFRIEREAYPMYLNYLLSSLSYKRYFMSVCSGFTRINLRQEHFLDIPLILPPLQEQKEIAEFLDKKCEKIQNYINKKQKLITLLQEKKQALINEAVCGRVACSRDFSPTAQNDKIVTCHTEPLGEVSTTAYKPSGIEWLGEIPQGWEIKKAKGIFKEVKRSVEDNDEIITCFRDGVVTLRKNRRTEGFTNSLKEIGYQGIRVNDLVIHSMDAFAGAIGVSDSNGKATPVYVVCVPRYDDLADNKYYAYLLRNMANSGFILSLAKGIRERSTEFKYNDFADLKIPLPPLHKQKEIAAFLDSKVAQINSVIEKTKRQIELVKEYKNTLINEAVCGRINFLEGILNE